jgi:hypothetical protein
VIVISMFSGTVYGSGYSGSIGSLVTAMCEDNSQIYRGNISH